MSNDTAASGGKDLIEATIKRKLFPFDVPKTVRFDGPPGTRQQGLGQPREIPVEELSKDSLNELANRWLKDLYTQCGYSGRKVPTIAFEPEPGIR